MTSANRAGQRTRRAGGEGETVRSIARAFELIHCLHPDRPAATLMELAKATAFPVSTTQRLLNTLVEIGILRRLATGAYTFGAELIRIGVVAMGSQQLYELVKSPLERLAAETGETANFAVPYGTDEAIYLRQVRSAHAMHHAGWLGRTLPGKGTAIGGALFGRAGKRGFVATRKTLEPEVTAVAAPIVGPDGVVAGALSITGPTFRIDDRDVERYGALLAREARRVSALIGGPPADPSMGQDHARRERVEPD